MAESNQLRPEMTLAWLKSKAKDKRFVMAGVVALSFILVAALIIGVNTRSIYAVEVNGEVIGYTDNIGELQDSLDSVTTRVSFFLQQEVRYAEEIDFIEISEKNIDPDDPNELKNKLFTNVSLETQAYVFMIDGEEFFGLHSEEAGETIIALLKENYKEEHERENSEFLEVSIKEDIEIVSQELPLHLLLTPQEAVDILLTGGKETKGYQVAQGDSLWSICKDYSMSLEELQKANPDVDDEHLSIGQTLNLNVINPYVTMLSREKLTDTVAIAYEEEVKRDSSMWTWERRVAQGGRSGQKEVVYEVIRENGIVVEKEKVAETVVTEPVPRIIVRGSRRDTSSSVVGTGRFHWPTSGQITRNYLGSRHTGVDIANSKGTPIRAADAGTVTVAVRSSVGYGNRLEISHGNGYTTLYAHCDSFAVRRGQTVKKGQVIAYMGNTGNTRGVTGVHLHFEIRKNGRHVNPMNYF